MLSKYATRCAFASVSSPRLWGTHLGSSCRAPCEHQKKKKHGIRHAHLEETQRADVIRHVEREAVVDTSRDDDQVAGGHREADPCVRGEFWVVA
jgi:hypothetical protein